MNRIGLLLLGCLLQTVVSVAADSPEWVRFRFRVLRVGEAPIGEVRCPSLPEPLSFVPDRFLPAGPFDYRGPPGMRFVAPGTPDTLLGQILVSAGLGRALLFLSADPSGVHPYRVDLLRDDPRAFPPGSLVLLNCTGRELLGRIGGMDAVLPEGPSPAFDCVPESEDGPLIQLAVQTRQGPRIVFTNRIGFAPGERAVLVLEPPRPSEPHRVRTCLFREQGGD